MRTVGEKLPTDLGSDEIERFGIQRTTMKLIKQTSRRYKCKIYYKYVIIVPNDVIKRLGWIGGERLETRVEDGGIRIRKS